MTQVGDVLRALGQNPTEGDVKKLVQSTNSKGGPDARVTFETFLPLLQVPKLSKVFSVESLTKSSVTEIFPKTANDKTL